MNTIKLNMPENWKVGKMLLICIKNKNYKKIKEERLHKEQKYRQQKEK